MKLCHGRLGGPGRSGRLGTRGAVAVLGGLALLLSACGGDTTESENRTTSTDEITKDDALAAKLPAEIRDAGKLVIATDASYAPVEFSQDGGKTFVGLDIDLGNAIGKVLGVEIEFRNVSFDGILAGVGTRYDLAMSAITDTKEREGEVDFVTYFQAGTAIAVQKGNPLGIKAEMDLCGKRVAAERGTTQHNDLTADKNDDGSPTLKARCVAGGKEAPTPVISPDQNAVNASLAADRADAFTADTPVADYQEKVTNGDIEKAAEIVSPAPYGIAVPKDSGTLKDALMGAVQELIDDEHYEKILATWNVQDGAVDESKINAAGSGG